MGHLVSLSACLSVSWSLTKSASYLNRSFDRLDGRLVDWLNGKIQVGEATKHNPVRLNLFF